MKWLARIALTILAFVLLYVGLSVWARSGRAPRAITVPYDRLSALFHRDYYTRCYLPTTISEGGFEVSESVPDRECLDWQPPRMFTGIFINEFEGQRFLEGVGPSTSYCPQDDVWLEFDEKSDRHDTPQLDPFAASGARIWVVRFVGRKTVNRGHYGHSGASPDQVLVDRVRSARLVAQFDGYVPDTVLQCR